MNVVWQEASLDNVMQYFIKGFDQTKIKIKHVEYFIDPVKKTVVFKLFTEETK